MLALMGRTEKIYDMFPSIC